MAARKEKAKKTITWVGPNGQSKKSIVVPGQKLRDIARVSDPAAFCPEIAFVAQMKHERMRDASIRPNKRTYGAVLAAWAASDEEGASEEEGRSAVDRRRTPRADGARV